MTTKTPKADQIRAMREKHADEIPTALRRGHPDCKFVTPPKPTAGPPPAPTLPARVAEPAKLQDTRQREKGAPEHKAPVSVTETPMTTTTKPKTAKASKPGKAKTKAKTAERRTVKSTAARPAGGNGARARYDWAAAEEKAKAGTVPPAIDFTADTHKPWRGLLEEVVKASKDKDVEALRKVKINPTSSSPKALDRYRKLCVTALTAK